MIKLIYTNVFDTSTVTALNTAGSTYTQDNLKDRFLKKKWRSTGLSNQWVKFDLGSSKLVDIFTFFSNNFTTAATVKLYGHATDLGNTESAWSTATYQSGSITNFDQNAAYVSPNVTLRWWLLAITDAGNSSGYVELGRVFGGQALSPTQNFNENLTEQHIDPSEQYWTIGGHAYSVQRERYKVFGIEFMDMNRTNQQFLRDFWNAVHKTEPFVVALDPTNEPVNQTRYCMLLSDLEFAWGPNDRVNASMSMRELR